MANGLSIWEEEQLLNLANKFIAQVKEAILHKKIQRYTQGMGNFQAEVNASGRLYNSVNSSFVDNAIEVSCLSYIHFLIYGRRPGGMPPINRIKEWIAVRGGLGDPWAVARNIAEHGTSIWQKHKGQDSGLLADIDIETDLRNLEEGLTKKYVSEIADDISKTFNLAA